MSPAEASRQEEERPRQASACCPACGAPALPDACEACGHRWREAEDGATLSYYSGLADRSQLPAADLARKYAQRLALVRPFLAPGARVLELGCAEGGFGAHVKAAVPVHYEGVEPSRDAEVAANRLDRVWRGTLAEVAPSGYDVILAFHMLEHVPAVGALLGAIAQRLAPDGVFIAEVPHEAGHPLVAVDPHPEHVHSFSAASLSAALGRAGLVVRRLETGGYESPLYPDGLRAIAQRRVPLAERRAVLVGRLRALGGATGLAIYGLGGDFCGWVAPYLDDLPDVTLIDGDPARAGARVAGRAVLDPGSLLAAPERPVLVASYRFEADIRERLAALGVAPSRIFGLADLYGAGDERGGDRWCGTATGV